MKIALDLRRARTWLRRSLPPLVWVLVCTIAGLACGGGAPAPSPAGEPEVDEISFDLFPTTRLLSPEDLGALRGSAEDGTLVFEPAPRALDDLAAGMVLVGGQSPATPEGLLRGVGEIQREGDRLTLRTMVVPVQLAFRRLSVRSAHRIRSIQSGKERALGDLKLQRLRLQNTDATGTKQVRWVLFDGDGDEDTLDDQVRLEGALGGGFYFDARFEINWGAVENLPQAVLDCLKSIPGILIGKLPDCTPLALLPEAKATFEVGPDLKAHADLIGSASLEFEKELAILKMSLTPIPIGPIVLVPGVDVLATLSGSAGARFRTGFDADLSARMALVASTKNGVSVTPPTLERSDVKARETELAIMARGRVSLGARISMSVYGIIGPYAQVDGFAELVADTSKDPCWEIVAGLSAHAGLLLTTPRLPVLGYVTLFDLKTPTWDIFRSGALASGSCSFAKGASLPGAGPDEQSYGKPAFPTWAKVAATPGEALFAATAVLDPGLAFTQMERATDGRFLAAASQSERLSKLDEAGQVLWTRGYADGDETFRLGRLTTLRDTSIVVGTTHQGAPAVLRVNQGGDAFPGATFSLDPGCSPGPIAALQALPAAGPGAAAYALTGGCLESDRAYLLTATASGEVRDARLLSVPAPATLTPRALTVVDGSLWWLGTYTPGGITHVAALRLDLGLSPRASGAYVGACENNRRIEPAFARPAKERSEVLIVGSSGGVHEGLFLRLRPDATVAVGSFPSFGPGASDVAVLQSIAELPTTGYVVSGSHRSVLAPAGSPYQNLAPFVAWLDAGANVLMARRFTLDGGATPVSSPRLDLTDDGGLMIASARARGDGQHDLWTMKTFAKDGSVAEPRVAVESFPFKSVTCGISPVALPLSVAPITAQRREFLPQNPLFFPSQGVALMKTTVRSPFAPPARGAALLLGAGLVLALTCSCTETAVSTTPGGGAGGTAGSSAGGSGAAGPGGAGAGVGGAGASAGGGNAGSAGAAQGGASTSASEAVDPPASLATEGIHVAPGGSDASGDGSQGNPYRTIQHALDSAAGPGSTVLLHGGTYQEQVRIRHPGLLLQAAQGEKAHITCPVSADENAPPLCVEIDAETTGVTLRGLEISGGFYAVYLGSHWDYDDTPLDNPAARGVVIEDCTIHDSGRDAVKLPAGCDDVTIRRCEIYNSGMAYPPGFPQEEKNAEGIDAVNSDNLRVADTYIHDTATTCVYVKGGSIGTIIERVRAERCGEVGIALGFDTSPEFFDTKANPGYHENLGGTVRNCIVQDTGLAGIGLFATQNARVLHNTVRRAATRGHAALYLGIATQDYDPKAGRPANQNPTLIGNILDQSGIPGARCFGIRHSVEDSLGTLSGLEGAITLRNNLYFAGGEACAFSDDRPASLLEEGDLAAWQAHAPGFDEGSSFQEPMLDPQGRLSAGSPAIDAIPATEGVSFDIDQQPRQPPYDLGADER